MKRIVLLLMIITLGAAAAAAQALPRMGHFNFSKIVNQYFTESRDFRQLKSYQEQLNEIMEEYYQKESDLQTEKLNAMENDNEARAAQIEEEIQNLLALTRQRQLVIKNKIVRLENNLYKSEGFVEELLSAIQYIAETEGYSHVFDVRDPNILYANPEFDITDKILNRLLQMAAN